MGKAAATVNKVLPVFGTFLVLLGLWWLAAEAGWVPFQGKFFGPVSVVAVGIGLILASKA